jgi:hypothetical protein
LKRNERLAKEFDRPQRSKKERPLLPVEQRSLLRILGAIITSRPYNFDHKSTTNSATHKIWNMADRENIDVDEDTVRTWLQEAAKEVAGCRDSS